MIQEYLASLKYYFASAWGCSVVEHQGLTGILYNQLCPEAALVDAEWAVWGMDARDAMRSIQREMGDSERYVVDIFHENPEPGSLTPLLKSLGYTFLYTTSIRKVTLTGEFPEQEFQVLQVKESRDVEAVNAAFHKEMPMSTRIPDLDHMVAYRLEEEGRAAAWGQMTLLPGGPGLVVGMYTLPEKRRRGYAAAVLTELHRHAHAAGVKEIVLVPSLMAWNYYLNFGYQPKEYFSIFGPL